MKYVKDEDVDWTPVVRRRRKTKNVRSEDRGSSGNLNVNDKRNLVEYCFLM